MADKNLTQDLSILLIDDEAFYYKLLKGSLKEAGYGLVDFASTGEIALKKIHANYYDAVAIDLHLSRRPEDMNGFEVLNRLRRDPKISQIPVIVISAADNLSEKLKAFEMGADDYLVKPFQGEEFVARMGILLRRAKAMKMKTTNKATANMVVVHSLRGGVGTTSLVVNLGLALYKLWGKQTLLVDSVLSAGHVVLMLGAKPTATWENLVGIDNENFDNEVVQDMVCLHKSGVSYIASPQFPIDPGILANDTLQLLMENLKGKNEFIVVDTSHDFSDMTIQMLSMSSSILLVMAPEMASLHSARSALEIYDRLGISLENVKIVLNNNSSNPAIKQALLEKVLKRPMDFVLPYEAGEVSRALNFGKPFILENPDLPLCLQLEKMAYLLSDDSHQAIPPAVPSPTWKRVTSQLNNK